MHPKKLASVLAQPAADRFGYFVRHVADSQQLWILSSESGWATAHDGSGAEALPLWPEREFAEACAVGEWSEYGAERVALEAFLDQSSFARERLL